MKIITILGARPQFIKASSVSREIQHQKQNGADINEIIVHTGQHYDQNMSDVFFEEMQIPKPDYFLGIGGKSHGAMTGQMIEKIEAILVKENPDLVLVYGDTNSTLAGAIAASKCHIKIAHVEAGLRSFNMKMPEEINRILTDRLSSLLFCPSQMAIDHLNQEGFQSWKTNAKIVLSGDVMQDGIKFYQHQSQKPQGLDISADFVLCTIHRSENTDHLKRLSEIILALNEISKEKQIVLPLHPRTKKMLQTTNLDTSKLSIINPLGYLHMIWLIKECSLVMTDSGGLQKEAYFLSKPCITLRDETEWEELIRAGINTLVGANKTKIIKAYQDHKSFNSEMSKLNLYGDGKASQKIVSKLLES